MSVGVEAQRPQAVGAEPKDKRPVPRWAWVLVVIAVWIVIWSLIKGKDTLVLAGSDLTALHTKMAEIANGIGENPVARGLADGINVLVDWLKSPTASARTPWPVV